MTDIEKSYMLLILTQFKYLKYMRFVVLCTFHYFQQQSNSCYKKAETLDIIL